MRLIHPDEASEDAIIVFVEKGYIGCESCEGDTHWIHGSIAVEEAPNENAAVEFLREVMVGKHEERCLQTIDPRISWDAIPDDDWEYADDSFQVIGDD